MAQRILPMKTYSPDATATVRGNGHDGNGRVALSEPHQQIAGGLPKNVHRRADANTSRVLEAASFLYSLIELLEENGIISIEELDARKTTVAKRVEKSFLDRGMGVNLQEPEREADPYQIRVKGGQR